MKTPLQAPLRREDAQPATDAAETPKRAERAPVAECENSQRRVVEMTRKLTGRL